MPDPDSKIPQLIDIPLNSLEIGIRKNKIQLQQQLRILGIWKRTNSFKKGGRESTSWRKELIWLLNPKKYKKSAQTLK